MKTCERCHQTFSCGAQEPASAPCWCTKWTAAQVPQNFKDCLCENCLKLFIKPEGADFYLDENGNTVFTEAYHLKRGYCCKSNCRHCPF